MVEGESTHLEKLNDTLAEAQHGSYEKPLFMGQFREPRRWNGTSQLSPASKLEIQFADQEHKTPWSDEEIKLVGAHGFTSLKSNLTSWSGGDFIFNY